MLYSVVVDELLFSLGEMNWLCRFVCVDEGIEWLASLFVATKYHVQFLL